MKPYFKEKQLYYSTKPMYSAEKSHTQSTICTHNIIPLENHDSTIINLTNLKEHVPNSPTILLKQLFIDYINIL